MKRGGVRVGIRWNLRGFIILTDPPRQSQSIQERDQPVMPISTVTSSRIVRLSTSIRVLLRHWSKFKTQPLYKQRDRLTFLHHYPSSLSPPPPVEPPSLSLSLEFPVFPIRISNGRPRQNPRIRSIEEGHVEEQQSRPPIPSRPYRSVLESRQIRREGWRRSPGLPRRRPRVPRCWGKYIISLPHLSIEFEFFKKAPISRAFIFWVSRLRVFVRNYVITSAMVSQIW